MFTGSDLSQGQCIITLTGWCRYGSGQEPRALVIVTSAAFITAVTSQARRLKIYKTSPSFTLVDGGRQEGTCIKSVDLMNYNWNGKIIKQK